MLELPYVAGLVDGEGCIALQYGSKLHHCLMLRVSIIMSNEKIISLLHEQFGGSFNKVPPRKANHKPMYRLSLSQNLAFAFVSAIQPWLIVKRRQADLVIMWWNGRDNIDKNEASQSVFLEVMHRLNKRGV